MIITALVVLFSRKIHCYTVLPLYPRESSSLGARVFGLRRRQYNGERKKNADISDGIDFYIVRLTLSINNLMNEKLDCMKVRCTRCEMHARTSRVAYLIRDFSFLCSAQFFGVTRKRESKNKERERDANSVPKSGICYSRTSKILYIYVNFDGSTRTIQKISDGSGR